MIEFFFYFLSLVLGNKREKGRGLKKCIILLKSIHNALIPVKYRVYNVQASSVIVYLAKILSIRRKILFKQSINEHFEQFFDTRVTVKACGESCYLTYI